MKAMNLQGKQKKSRYRSYRGTVGKIAPNILNRHFYSQKPFEKLVTDVTEFKVCNEKVYLSPVMDLFNHEIVAHSISRHPSFAQTQEMLDRLFEKLPSDAMPVLNSDQGWQYQMSDYRKRLAQHNITQVCQEKEIAWITVQWKKTEMFLRENFASVEDFIKKIGRIYLLFQ